MRRSRKFYKSYGRLSLKYIGSHGHRDIRRTSPKLITLVADTMAHCPLRNASINQVMDWIAETISSCMLFNLTSDGIESNLAMINLHSRSKEIMSSRYWMRDCDSFSPA